MGLKEQILTSNDLPRVKIDDIQEWGITPECPVYVATLWGMERDDFEAASIEQQGGNGVTLNRRNFTARFVAKCLQDEAGARIFADDEVAALGKKSCRILNRIFGIAQRLNALSKADVKELEKNSENGRSA